ncbi:ankyrin repeat domain-containing protein [Paraburkholderia xenovorans]|uniref:ankyrin repeat domain-containing protein n=1 Tax=Paraburkholderia xenovorans TaxID=36873 RepID=UPI0038BA0918
MKCAGYVLTFAALVSGCTSAQLPPASATQHERSPYTEVNASQYDSDWFAAARAGRIDILQALIDAHYPVDRTTPQGYTALILAAYDDQPEAVTFLLNEHADACMGDRNGNTALMGALFKGEEKIARMLLDTQCAIDQTNHAGETALSFAALFGRFDMLPLLAARGADPNHADARGATALQMAHSQGNLAAQNALRAIGARE